MLNDDQGESYSAFERKTSTVQTFTNGVPNSLTDDQAVKQINANER